MSLSNRRVAILIAPQGTEEPEFSKPLAALREAGANVTVIGLETGEAHTVNNDLEPGAHFPVDRAIADVTADEFDALVIPGGCVGADKLRASEDVVDFVRDFFVAAKPVGVICHAPWLLVEADVLEGRTLTSWATLRTDLENAGANWIDEEVVSDRGLVSSRNPHDLPAFCATIVEEFAA
jgi:protease I